MKAAHPRPAQLFLYGSLLTGTPHPRLNRAVRRLLRRSRPAMIHARLYDLGAYPGAVPAHGDADRVYGRLITVMDAALLRALDRYEDYFSHYPGSSEFRRVIMNARLLASRRPVRCWAYLYNGEATDKRHIAEGDYVKFSAHNRKRL